MGQHWCPCSRESRECVSSHVRAIKGCESLYVASYCSLLKHSHRGQAKCGVVPDRFC